MSFSADVKRELCGVSTSEKSELYAELYGMLLFCNRFSSREIVYKTENKYSALRFEDLLTELFTPIIEKKSDLAPKVKDTGLYKVSIMIPDECRRIFEYYGHTTKEIKLRINRANLGAESLYAPFLRGVFLSCGSVTDPQKGNHLELMVRHKTLAENLMHFIGEVEVFSVNPKVISRKGSYLVYIKGSDNICDFLGFIGAGNSVMRIIETSAYKDMINDLTRRQNSELSNIRKLADAAAKQIRAINIIKDRDGLDSLPEELRSLCELRLENPEMSLKELAAELKISRSGVNHRIDRLYKIADEKGDNNE